MAILITGLPRSGTTFMLQLISEHGHDFEPQLQTHFMPIKVGNDLTYNLNEPQVLSNALRHGQDPRDALTKIIQQYKKFDPETLVLKLPQAAFIPLDILDDYFEKIILCYRFDMKSWASSAIGHGLLGYLEDRPAWLPKRINSTMEIFDYWLERTFSIKVNLDKCENYCFMQDESLHKVLKFLNFKYCEMNHNDFPCWKGTHYGHAVSES